MAPEEVIQEIIRHLGGPEDNPGRRVWLAEHYEKFEKALEAVALARRRAMFDALDGQFGKAVYAWRNPPPSAGSNWRRCRRSPMIH